MNRHGVIASLGEPDDTLIGPGDREFLVYRKNGFFVHLANGKVVSYGMLMENETERKLSAPPPQAMVRDGGYPPAEAGPD